MSARQPLQATCTRCGARVLETTWDDHEGMPPVGGIARLDLVALDRQHILAAVITGLPLYQLQTTSRGLHTTSLRWYGWPAAPLGGHVIPAHRCGAHWDAFPINLAPDPTQIPDTCPF